MENRCMDLRTQYTEKEVINYEALHDSSLCQHTLHVEECGRDWLSPARLRGHCGAAVHRHGA